MESVTSPTAADSDLGPAGEQPFFPARNISSNVRFSNLASTVNVVATSNSSSSTSSNRQSQSSVIDPQDTGPNLMSIESRSDSKVIFSEDGAIVPRSSAVKTEAFVFKLISKLGISAPEAGIYYGAFSCALEKKVLYHGRLYVFGNLVVFDSKVFSGTRLILRRGDFKNVVQKAVNRLGVETSDGKLYIFASFANRGKCFKFLTLLFIEDEHVKKMLLAANDSNREQSEEESFDHGDHGGALSPDAVGKQEIHENILDGIGGLRPEAEPDKRESVSRTRSLVSVLSKTTSKGSLLGREDPQGSVLSRKESTGSHLSRKESGGGGGLFRKESGSLLVRRENSSPELGAQLEKPIVQRLSVEAEVLRRASQSNNDKDEHLDPAMKQPRPEAPLVNPEDQLAWVEANDAMDIVIGKCYNDKTFCSTSSFPVSCKVAYHALFANGSSATAFLREYHLKIGDQEPIDVGLWSREPLPEDKGSGSEKNMIFKREVRFVHPLSYKFGPSRTNVLETHHASFLSNGGFRVEVSGHNIDVPYSDQFRVESTFELTPTSDSSCELSAYVTTRFIGKKPVVSSMIEKGTIVDTTPAYKTLCDISKVYVDKFYEELHAAAKKEPTAEKVVSAEKVVVAEKAPMTATVAVPAVVEEEMEENDDDLPDPEAGLAWSTDEDNVDKIHGELYDSKTECFRIMLPYTIKMVFNALIADAESSVFITKYHTGIGDKEPMSVGPWTVKDGFKTREVRFVHPLSYKIGPSQTNVLETQFLHFTSTGGFVLEAEGHNLDVPYSDQFRIESTFEFRSKDGVKPATSAGSVNISPSSTELIAYVTTRFIGKKPMVSKIIEKGTIDDCGPAYKRFCEIASQYTDAYYENRPGMAERKLRMAKRLAKKRHALPGAPVPKKTAAGKSFPMVEQKARTLPPSSVTVIAKAPFELFGLDGNFVMELALLLLLFGILIITFCIFILLLSMKLEIASNRRY